MTASTHYRTETAAIAPQKAKKHKFFGLSTRENVNIDFFCLCVYSCPDSAATSTLKSDIGPI